MTTPMMMQSSLIRAIAAENLPLAKHFFNNPASISIGGAVPGFAANPIHIYKSFADYEASTAAEPFVGYDNEGWQYTPLGEQQNPTLYMAQFAELAHARGAKVMMMPAQDLLGVPGTAWTSYMADAPKAASVADYYEVQAQGRASKGVAAYASFFTAAHAAARPGQPVWAGLTSLRTGDTEAVLFGCWKATSSIAAGYWLNSSPSTLSMMVKFLLAVRAAGG